MYLDYFFAFFPKREISVCIEWASILYLYFPVGNLVKWEYWLINPEAQGPEARRPRALLDNIPTPLNFQMGNTCSISHLTSHNKQQISLKTELGNTKKHTVSVLGREEGYTVK